MSTITSLVSIHFFLIGQNIVAVGGVDRRVAAAPRAGHHGDTKGPEVKANHHGDERGMLSLLFSSDQV